MPSLVNTLRRCHSTVRADRNSWAPISGFDRPSRASRAICSSCGGELVARLGAALAHLLARGDQLPAGALGERLHADRGEHLVGGAQLRRARRRGGSRGAATRRRADGRGRAPGGAGSGRAARSPRGTSPRRRRRRSAAPAQRASMPSAEVGPAGLGRLRQPLERIGARRSASPVRAAASTSSGSAHMEHPRIECVSRWPAGPPPRLVVTAEAVVQDRGRPVRVGRRHPLSRAAACSIALAISAEASASLPCSAQSLSAMYGGKRLPVAAATLSVSAISAAAPAKSPIHALARANAERWTGSCASAPASRASWTCRAEIARTPSASHTRALASAAIQPQRRTSSTGISGERFGCPLQRRSRGGASVGDQQREAVEQQVERARRTRRRREGPGGAGDLRGHSRRRDARPCPPRARRSGRSRGRGPGRTVRAASRP